MVVNLCLYPQRHYWTGSGRVSIVVLTDSYRSLRSQKWQTIFIYLFRAVTLRLFKDVRRQTLPLYSSKFTVLPRNSVKFVMTTCIVYNYMMIRYQEGQFSLRKFPAGIFILLSQICNIMLALFLV